MKGDRILIQYRPTMGTWTLTYYLRGKEADKRAGIKTLEEAQVRANAIKGLFGKMPVKVEGGPNE